MILRRLFFGRAPGITQSFTLDNLSPQINVVVGPNGSGKTSICRALAATLWPSSDSPTSLEVETLWDDDSRTLHAKCEGKRVSWDRDGISMEPPALPDRHLAACYTLGVRDLMQEHSATDQDIARRIRIQMAGGYDVRRVIHEGFATKKRSGANERREIIEARAEVGTVRTRFSALADDEDRLVELEEQQRGANKAGRELKMLDEAIELARLRKSIDSFNESLDSFPPSLDAFTGDEIDSVAQQESDLGDCDLAIEGFELDVEKADEKIRLANLDAQRPAPSNLKSWTTRVTDLRDQERDLRNARKDEVTAKADLASATSAFDGDGVADSVSDFSTEAIDQVAAFVKRRDELNGEGASIRARLELLEPAASFEDRDKLVHGAGLLRDWLSTPRSAHIELPSWLFIVCAAVSVLGVVLAYYSNPLWIALSGFGIGVLTATLLSRNITKDAGVRLPMLASQFDDCGLGVPDRWSRRDVSILLSDLEQRIAKANMAEEQAAQRTMVQVQLDRLKREEADHDNERAELQKKVGVRVASELSLADLVYRYRAFHDASKMMAEASALVDNTNTLCSASVEGACAFLAPFGYEPKSDAAGLDADLLHLKDRLGEYDNAIESRDSAKIRLNDEKDRKIGIETRIEGYFQIRGLKKGDRGALEQMVSRLPAYKEIKQDREQSVLRIQALEHSLSERRDLLNLTPDVAVLRRDDAKQMADKLEAVSNEIGGIESRVDEARSGDALEVALARLNEARGALQSLCDQVQIQTAGRFLLGEVDSEHERSSRPPVLEKAAEYFRAFTHNAYELQLPDADEPEFKALDTSAAKSLQLSELSDGTRIQLLLAVRIAFAVHAEHGSKVPLMFDEALSTADPVRFRAVAESLLLLAKGGRQIFYMTANPADAAAWTVACAEGGEANLSIIDLGKERSGQAAITDETLFQVPQSPEIRKPAGMTAEQYGVALGVPPADPLKPVESLHLFYLLRDDLKSLYILIREARITTVGQWISLSASGIGIQFVPVGLCQRLDAVCECAREVFEYRAIGRGKPVDGDVLENSGEVSKTFLPRLTALASDLGGDAERFLAALDDRTEERVKGFRADALNRLRVYLEDSGYVDPRPVPNEDDVRLHVIGQAQPLLDAGALTREKCGRFVDQLLGALNIRDS